MKGKSTYENFKIQYRKNHNHNYHSNNHMRYVSGTQAHSKRS